jgi:fatty acid desaturase
VIPAREPEKKTSNEEAERKLRELLPTAIFVLISVALLALLIACFATGVCEAAIILAGATAAVALIIIGVLRHAGVDIRGAPGPPTA